MQRLYNFIIDHIAIIATVMLLCIIPDFIFKGWVLFAHSVAITSLIIIMLIGEIFRLEYEREPCRFCSPMNYSRNMKKYNGFTIHDNAIWFNDSSSGQIGININYCPVCGRELEGDDV